PLRQGKNWRGFSDFLGSKPSAKYVEMWPFAKARNYVRSLKLASSTEYFKWTNGGWKELPKKPAEVPVVPAKKYRDEWRGWDDWLGPAAPVPPPPPPPQPLRHTP